ncbi:rho GTPase-activating protein 26 isoform X3 [Zootermopsis nevadensis]|uniref:rho GTPase-activating protein 26 isoform X3 n=1 Tax=Zootermopsis nevadensis TaxID=136037 RepID=UPI000B8E50D1|nr:rho GTPase-activating protein 26 isoform X3 [Zootermopsis nevadensis]
MGVGLQPLEFSDCLTDSPYFREKLHTHEKELERTSQQIKGLVKEVKDLLSAAKNLSRAQRTLSNSLVKFNFECIGTSQTDDEVGISVSLKEFGRLIANIEDQRDMMLDRAYDQIILPLENFRKEHIGGVKEGKKKFEKQTAKFCMSQERYLNLSTKKQDAVLKEADATLIMEQRHFVRASLEYVFLLQEVQERKKFEFVETLLGFMYGWLTFYHQGHEVANEFKPYMRELQFKIQKTRENFNATRDKTESLMKKMLEVRQTKSMESGGPYKSHVREGYLFLMEKKAFGTTWTKHYCIYHKDSKEFKMIPYNQMTGKFTSPDTMILASCTRRMSDSIEKRFCFDITSDNRPGMLYTLQALSEDDRKLWMDVMDGKEPTYAMPGKIPKPEERNLDETGFNFVKRCIEVLENRGLEEQGLYRVVGVSSKVSKLLSMGLDRRKADKLSALDDHFEWESKTITSSLKTYLRNLPEPLMTFRYHNGFIAAAKQETRALRVHDVHTLVHRLPQQNRDMLDIIIKHLQNVAAKSDKNLMTVSNLGVCFGPTLLRPEEETVAAIMDIKFCNVVVEILIENYEKIFKTSPEQVDPSRPEARSSPSVNSPPVQNHVQTTPSPPLHSRPQKFNLYPSGGPPVQHAVIKSYYDGPVPISLSSSLHNVAPVREREGNGVGYVMGRVEHMNNTGQQQHLLLPNQKVAGGMRGGPQGSMGAYSESNLLALGSQQHRYSPQHHVQHKNAFLFGNMGNSERTDPTNSGTSSSNESVSSQSVRDINNHNNYSAISPQKSKRGNVLGTHYATSYRAHDAVMTQSSSSTASGRSSPATPGVRRVRTLYACLGENDGELSFEPNQIITNVRPSLEPGWLEGTLNGKTGLVPENYVEFLP